MQAAIARLAHSTRFKELLAGNWNLLVTTTGAEYVPTVPAVVLPAGKPEGAVARVAVGGQVVREPTGHLRVLFIHLLPAGFRENLCAAARQTVLIQIAFRVGN